MNALERLGFSGEHYPAPQSLIIARNSVAVDSGLIGTATYPARKAAK